MFMKRQIIKLKDILQRKERILVNTDNPTTKGAIKLIFAKDINKYIIMDGHHRYYKKKKKTTFAKVYGEQKKTKFKNGFPHLDWKIIQVYKSG